MTDHGFPVGKKKKKRDTVSSSSSDCRLQIRQDKLPVFCFVFGGGGERGPR